MKKIIYLETCHPDYFQGFGGDTLIAFHWKGQTCKEAIDNLAENSLNELHESYIFDAIEEYKKNFSSDKLIISEKFCEFTEEGDSGLVHYFGIIENEN